MYGQSADNFADIHAGTEDVDAIRKRGEIDIFATGDRDSCYVIDFSCCTDVGGHVSDAGSSRAVYFHTRQFDALANAVPKVHDT